MKSLSMLCPFGRLREAWITSELVWFWVVDDDCWVTGSGVTGSCII